MPARKELTKRLAQLKKEIADTERIIAGIDAEPELVSSSSDCVDILGSAAYQLIADYATDFISIQNDAGIYMFASPSCQHLLGWSPADLIGKSVYDFLCSKDLNAIADGEKDSFLDEALPLTHRFKCKNGDYRWVETTSRLHVTSGGARKIISITRDVNEREQLMRQLESANSRLVEMASTDELTGVANRRAFNERLKYLTLEAERGRPLSLILCDIDHFKVFNDRHGHPAGDEILYLVGQKIKDTCRQVDLACRYGGEEFAILLPGTHLHGAKVLANRLRRIINDIPTAYEPITVSFGVCSFGGMVRTGNDLLSGADKALYLAKGNGRNKVEIYEENAPLRIVDVDSKR